MKPNPWLYPGLALLAVGGWIGMQKKSIAAMNRETALLRAGVLKIQTQEAADEKARSTRVASASKTIDWKSLGRNNETKRPGDMPDMRAMSRMARILKNMTPEELIRQLDEIDALDLSEKARDPLISMVIFRLIETQPEYVMERYKSRLANLRSGFLGTSLTVAFTSWAMKDPQAATRWFDQQVEAGTFESKALDGKSDARRDFEGALIKQIITTDLQAAMDRVLRLSPDDRLWIFERGNTVVSQFQDPKIAENYSRLLRSSLPADKVSKILADYANSLFVKDDFTKIDQFIASTQATSDDRKAVTASIFQSQLYVNRDAPLSRETLETVRTWAAQYSPETVDQTTGNALAQSLIHRKDYDKIAALILDYQQSTGSDEILTSFLENPNTQSDQKHFAQTQELILKIKDPSTRERIQNLPGYRSK
ncbi:MAG: hypothetical protein QM680_02260 [Luteolibacter sp.]